MGPSLTIRSLWEKYLFLHTCSCGHWHISHTPVFCPTHAHMDSSNWTQWDIYFRMKSNEVFHEKKGMKRERKVS